MTRQVRLLARTFFTRFFESELMPPGLPQVQLVIWSMALLAGPGLLLPGRFAGKYIRLEHYPQALAHALLVDRLVFITLTMTAAGIVALVIWDGVFPDRRDARILGVLPVRDRVLVMARLHALAVLAGILLVGVNAVPTLMYGPMTAAYGVSASMAQGVVAHFATTMSAGAFVFFALIALQGCLLNLFGRQAAERLAVVLQMAFVIGLLQMVFFLPRLGGFFTTDLQQAASHPVLKLVPSVWFLGLYDVLGGRPGPEATALSLAAVVATSLAVLSSAGLLVGSHRRLTRLALESRDAGTRLGMVRNLAARVSRVLARPGVEWATFDFTVRTLARSRQHRMLLALYGGVGLALIVSTLVPIAARGGMSAFVRPSIAVLSAPLVVVFFALVGMRVVFAIPVEPKANWIFRLLEPVDRVAAVRGVRRALVFCGVVPAVALSAAGAALLWNAYVAIVHATAVALLGLLLIELLLIRLDKLPFTCSYYPGTSKTRTLWPFYLIAFTNYCYTSTAIELSLLGNELALIAWALGIGATIAALGWLRNRELRDLPALRFTQEDPEAMFEGFRLSEALAAQAPVARRPRPGVLGPGGSGGSRGSKGFKGSSVPGFKSSSVRRTE